MPLATSTTHTPQPLSIFRVSELEIAFGNGMLTAVSIFLTQGACLTRARRQCQAPDLPSNLTSMPLISEAVALVGLVKICSLEAG